MYCISVYNIAYQYVWLWYDLFILDSIILIFFLKFSNCFSCEYLLKSCLAFHVTVFRLQFYLFLTRTCKISNSQLCKLVTSFIYITNAIVLRVPAQGVSRSFSETPPGFEYCNPVCETSSFFSLEKIHSK